MTELIVIIVGVVVVLLQRFFERLDRRRPLRDNPHHPDKIRTGDVAWSLMLAEMQKINDNLVAIQKTADTTLAHVRFRGLRPKADT